MSKKYPKYRQWAKVYVKDLRHHYLVYEPPRGSVPSVQGGRNVYYDRDNEYCYCNTDSLTEAINWVQRYFQMPRPDAVAVDCCRIIKTDIPKLQAFTYRFPPIEAVEAFEQGKTVYETNLFYFVKTQYPHRAPDLVREYQEESSHQWIPMFAD